MDHTCLLLAFLGSKLFVREGNISQDEFEVYEDAGEIASTARVCTVAEEKVS
jgi:hypothetical protein